MFPSSLRGVVLCGIFASLLASLVLCAIVSFLLLLLVPLLLALLLLLFFFQISGSLVSLLRFFLHPLHYWWCSPVSFFALLSVFFWEFSVFDHFVKFCPPQRCYCHDYLCRYVFVIVHLFFPSVLWFFLRLFVVVLIPTWCYISKWRLVAIVHFFLGPVLRFRYVCFWSGAGRLRNSRQAAGGFFIPLDGGGSYAISLFFVSIQPLDEGNILVRPTISAVLQPLPPTIGGGNRRLSGGSSWPLD